MKNPKLFFGLVLLVLVIALALPAIVNALPVTHTALTPVVVAKAGLADITDSPQELASYSSTNYLKWPSEKYGLVLMLVATNLSDIQNSSPKLTIRKGDNPPAFLSGMGDLNLSLTDDGVYLIGPLESARFKNQSGYLNLYGTNITTGLILAEEFRK